MPNPKHANHPVLLPNDYTAIRDTVRRASTREGPCGCACGVKGVRSGAPFLFLGLAFVLTLLLQKSSSSSRTRATR